MRVLDVCLLLRARSLHDLDSANMCSARAEQMLSDQNDQDEDEHCRLCSLHYIIDPGTSKGTVAMLDERNPDLKNEVCKVWQTTR